MRNQERRKGLEVKQSGESIRIDFTLMIITTALLVGLLPISARADDPPSPRKQIVWTLQIDPPYQSKEKGEKPPTSQPSEIDAIWQRQINTHAKLICAPATINRTIMKPDGESEIRKRQWFKDAGEEKAIALLLQNLHVNPVAGTNLIEISIDNMPTPLDEVIAIEEVVNTYIASEQQRVRNAWYDESVVLNNRKIRGQMKLRDISQEYSERLKLDDSDPNVADQTDLIRKERDRARDELAEIDKQMEFIALVANQTDLSAVHIAARAYPPKK